MKESVIRVSWRCEEAGFGVESAGPVNGGGCACVCS